MIQSDPRCWLSASSLRTTRGILERPSERLVNSESERVCGSFRDAAAYQQCLSQLEREGSLVRLSLGINLAETDPSRRGRRLSTSGDESWRASALWAKSRCDWRRCAENRSITRRRAAARTYRCASELFLGQQQQWAPAAAPRRRRIMMGSPGAASMNKETTRSGACSPTRRRRAT